MARASQGAAEFIYPGERIEPKVLRMFGRVQPAFKHVHIDWGGLEVEQAPAVCPPVFGGDSLTVFGRLQGGTTDTVILHADAHTWEVPITLAQPDTGGPTFPPYGRAIASAIWRGRTEPRYAAAPRRSARPTALLLNSSSWDSATACCRAPPAMSPLRSAVRRTRPPPRLSCGKFPSPSPRAGMVAAVCYRRWQR